MRSEKLLEEAKRRYPVGTKIKSISSGEEYITTSLPKNFFAYHKDGIIAMDNTGDDRGVYLYKEGKWAEIVELPKQENTPQFEVGKWYYNSPTTWAKCSSIRSLNSFNFEESISNGTYKKIKGNWIYHPEMKEVSLEEIQPYLPDGHPDKIVKQESNMFKKGEYIVTLSVKNSGNHNCAKNNYCFKQRENHSGIYPEIDLQGSPTNGHDVMSFDKTKFLNDWRYATPEEITEYDRLGKPYDVTTLQKKEEYKIGDWVLLSNDAAGWGAAPNQINNKILQITGIDLNDNPTLSSKGRYYFGNIRTIGREIVRKALPHEIPQENNNDIIEVGDEVEITDSLEKDKIGLRGILLKDDRSEVPYYVKTASKYRDTWCINVKLIKKASQTTTTYEKQVAEQPKNVPITTDIRIPKSISVTLTNAEKEVKLTIKKPKTIKI